MRVLALDYGRARCGYAVSDPTGTIATPLGTIPAPASRRGLNALAALVADLEAERVVVGLPLSLRGDDTEQTRETRAFARALGRRLGDHVEVELHDERFTTRLAQRHADPRTSEDARAAAHLLDSWLTASARAGSDSGSGTHR